MGNKIYNDGQQNLSERATKFIGTGNGNFTQIPLFFRKRRAYRIFFSQRIIYICACKKKNQYLIAGRPPKGFFFNEVGIKKAAFCAPSAGWRGGERAHEKRKRLSLRKKQPLICCGGKTRTYDLWVMSPTSYHCSTPRCRCDHSRLRVQR